MPDLWFEVEVEKTDVMVVDCGYLIDQDARDRVDALCAFGIGRKNVPIEMNDRLLVKIPESKRAAVLEKFPIDEGKVYYGTTHHFRELSQKTREK